MRFRADPGEPDWMTDAYAAAVSSLSREVNAERTQRLDRLRQLLRAPVLAGLNDMGDMAELMVAWPWPSR